jgi:3-deoxy-D-manno-octulosonic-acid transferase
MSSSVVLSLYRIATALIAPAMPAWLQARVKRGKEEPARWRERFGETAVLRPTGKLIWLHAASIGETTSTLPLVAALTERGFSTLMTTGTVTAAQLIESRALPNVIHQYAPLDHTDWIERFLQHWQPDIALRVDSEIWPNTLTALHHRNIPIVQINARMSAKAFDTWSVFPGFMRSVFETLSLVCAQSEIDRIHFEKLGARKAINAGNLKLAQMPLPFDRSALDHLKNVTFGRPTWTAGSIHPGEDQIVAQAHLTVKKKHPTALAYVVPRHNTRGSEMALTMRNLGLNVARRSQNDTLTSTTDVYIADTMGELGLFYRLAPICFVGKSFAVGGGQNPAEPAQLGAALVWGPDMSNFSELAAALEKSNAALKLASATDLGEAIAALLSEPQRTADMGAAGQRYIADNGNALNRTLELLAPYLERA